MLRSRDDILRDITELILLHQQGKLGGEKMPEDEHPPLEPSSAANYHYFTLPMALNYQRNSYALWESAHRTFNDPDTMDVFDPAAAAVRHDRGFAGRGLAEPFPPKREFRPPDQAAYHAA
ncbi:hypothetical protein VQ056_03825 [Paenibacillus sp. JTLBN-2024]